MIVILGSGMAGFITAEKIRDLDKNVPILMITNQDGRYYPKPQLSIGWSKSKRSDDLTFMQLEQAAEKLNMQIIPNTEIQQINTKDQTVATNQGLFEYSHCVYALGSHAVSLPFPISTRAQKINNLDDYDNFLNIYENIAKKDDIHIGVIGCGLIGYELIGTLESMGCRVSAFHDKCEMLNQLLPPVAQRYVTEKMSRHCDYYPSFRTSAITDLSNGKMKISDGQRSVDVDHVIVAIGVRGNTKVAEVSGMPLDQNGVVIDTSGRVEGYDSLWSLGDCASFEGESHKYVGHIRQMADVIAYNITCVGQGDEKLLQKKVMPYNVKSTICGVTVMGHFYEQSSDVDWQWEKGDDYLVGRQIEQGKLTAWCFTGNDTHKKAEMLKSMSG